MEHRSYRVTDTVAGFDEGDVLDVTARFGDWHVYSMKLKRNPRSFGSTTVVVTGGESAGFSEAAVLDETARIGDWHECDLTFEPGEDPVEEVSRTRIRITEDELDRIAEPVSPTA